MLLEYQRFRRQHKKNKLLQYPCNFLPLILTKKLFITKDSLSKNKTCYFYFVLSKIAPTDDTKNLNSPMYRDEGAKPLQVLIT